MSDKIKTYKAFYAFYLNEHQNKISRILHFIGTFLVFIVLGIGFYLNWTWQFIFVPITGYFFAWIGHAFFEKNKPATFKYPFWSLISDFKLFFEILTGRRHFDFRKDI